MVTGRRRSVLALGIATIGITALLGQPSVLLSETEAFWTDPEHTSASVTSGGWPTSGYGLGIASRVNSAGNIVVLPTGPNSLPWNGSRSEHDAALPGTTTRPGAGPFASQPATVGVNSIKLDGGTANAAVAASSCGSYTVGMTATPTYCTSGTPTASAAATVSAMRLTGSVASVGLLGAISLINSDIVSITPARALTASASCNLIGQTTSRTPPKAADASGTNPNGTVRVGNRDVRVPNPGSTTGPLNFNDGLLLNYSDVRLTSTASAENSTSAAFAKLTLTGSFSLLGLGALPLSFSVDLVNAQCGPGAAPAGIPAATALGRTAADPETTSGVPTTTGPETTTPLPSETVTATTAHETTTSIASTTTAEAAVAPATGDTTTMEVSPPVEAAEPSPVETAEPPPPTTTTPVPATTTEPPDPATVFTGPAEGNVEALTFGGDIVCRAPADADYSGNVELACDDGTSITAIGTSLTPAAIAASTSDGVWSPVLTAGGTARPVVSAIRG